MWQAVSVTPGPGWRKGVKSKQDREEWDREGNNISNTHKKMLSFRPKAYFRLLFKKDLLHIFPFPFNI